MCGHSIFRASLGTIDMLSQWPFTSIHSSLVDPTTLQVQSGCFHFEVMCASYAYVCTSTLAMRKKKIVRASCESVRPARETEGERNRLTWYVGHIQFCHQLTSLMSTLSPHFDIMQLYLAAFDCLFLWERNNTHNTHKLSTSSCILIHFIFLLVKFSLSLSLSLIRQCDSSFYHPHRGVYRTHTRSIADAILAIVINVFAIVRVMTLRTVKCNLTHFISLF